MLLTIIPTRSRPHSVALLAQAWLATGAPAHAELLLAADTDDPQLPAYRDAVAAAGQPWLRLETYGAWRPMVPKLNAAALRHANSYTALGFAGDDHLPRTPGWAADYLTALCALDGVGIVHGDDGRWHGALPTEWAMASAVVRELGRMVPAQVDHLYCDNAVMELGDAAQCRTYLPGVLIEHMHPAVGKADWDPGYRAVNSEQQYTHDGAAFHRWRRHILPRQAAQLRELRAAARWG